MAIASSWFRSGTVSVTQNQVVVQGFNTAWVNHLTPIGEGDAFTTDFHTVYEVVEVLSDTQIRLDRPYAGSNGAKVPYAIIRNGSSNFSVRTAASVQKSLAWYQEQLATSEKLLTEDGDVTVSLPDGTDITLWTEKKKQRLWDAKMAEAQKELDDFKAESAEAVNRERFERCALSKAMAEAQAAINRNLFKGSGFVNMGKHLSNMINPGMWCTGSTTLVLGRTGESRSNDGDSLTPEPVINVNGTLIHITQGAGHNAFHFKYAPSPDGTQTYDAATGIYIDYKTYLDPKYNSIAGSHNEAVCRAHEGILFNGDFRLGSENWELLEGATLASGKVSLERSPTLNKRIQIIERPKLKKQTDYEVSMYVHENTGYIGISIGAGSASLGVQSIMGTGYKTVKFNSQELESVYFSLGMGSSSGTAVVSNVSLRPATEKVIYTRQDLNFIESWDEDTSEKGVVFPKGCVMWLSSTWQGIPCKPLSELGIPQGYSAQGEWDTETEGRGIALNLLSFSQLAAFTVDPENNCYYDPETSKLIQTRWRGISVMGLGDNWETDFRSQSDSYIALAYNSRVNNRIGAQGSSTTPRGYIGNTIYNYKRGLMTGTHLEQFVPGQYIACAFDGITPKDITYKDTFVTAIPVALVQFLNQGAMHPTYNPFGCRRFNATAEEWNNLTWERTQAYKPKTSKDCFIIKDGNPNTGDNSHAYVNSGSISSARSGRPDTDPYKFYDAINPGQVQDLRISVRYKSPALILEDAMRAAIAGTMRGKGKVPFTIPMQGEVKFFGHLTDFRFTPNAVLDLTRIGRTDKVIAITSTGNIIISKVNNTVNNFISCSKLVSLDGSVPAAEDIANAYVLVESELTPEFDILPWTDLVCALDSLFATFPNGVMGQWINRIPDDSGKSVKWYLNRKNTLPGAKQPYTYTANNGNTWGSAALATVDEVSNSHTTSWESNHIALIQYSTLANCTKKTDSSKIVGLVGDVFATCRYLVEYGNRLFPSLIGEVAKSNRHTSSETVMTMGYSVTKGGRLETTEAYYPKHNAISLAAPSNNSQAIKALYTLAEKGGSLYLQLHGNSMKHNGTSWGDNGQIPIIDGEGTMTNDNGDTVKTFCHHSIFPIGIA